MPERHTATTEMTWGQKAMLRQLVRDRPPHHFNLVSNFTIPNELPDIRLDKIVEALVKSHAVLHTRFNWSEDATAGTQSLLPDSTIDIHRRTTSMSDVEAAFDPQAEAAFDFSTEIPVRAYVIETSTERILRLVFSHIAVDGWGVGLISAQVRTLLTGGRPGPPLVRPVEPAELAARERSEGMQARSRGAMTHWAECLSRLDALGPGYRDRLYEGRQAPRMSYQVTSTEVYSHVSKVAARYRITRAAVFLGVLSRAIGLMRQVRHVPYLFETANRTSRDTRAYAGTMSQSTPCIITLAPTWDEHFHQCSKALLRGVRCGYYDPYHLKHLTPPGDPAPELRFGNHFNYMFIRRAAAKMREPGARVPWSGVEFGEWRRPGRYETGVGIGEITECSAINLILDPAVYDNIDGVAILDAIRTFLRLLAAGDETPERLRVLVGDAAGKVDDSADVVALAEAQEGVPAGDVEGFHGDPPGEERRDLGATVRGDDDLVAEVGERAGGVGADHAQASGDEDHRTTS